MGGLTIGRLWNIAIRDLGRNRRRSILTLVAVSLGLGMLVIISGIVEGEIGGALDNNIRLKTGHIQLRASSYDEDRLSLAWEDLLENPQGLAEQVKSMDEVVEATPLIWASGVLGTSIESVQVSVMGIDPISSAHRVFREGLVAGEFLSPEDRSGILLGRRLAEDLELSVGQDVSLLISTADQQPDEAIFAIRGLYDTGVPAYDEITVFLPLAKAQTFTRAEGKASAIFVLLKDKDHASSIAARIASPEWKVLTWEETNQMLLQAVEMAAGYMGLINLIVLAVVAVVIANTLLMAVFERTREMGILSALGMKGGQIMGMFLLEAATLAFAGLILGNILGGIGVAYLGEVGIHIGEVASATGSFGIGEIIYARYSVPEVISLSILSVVITMLAALYPAWFAARMEPIEALRTL